MGLSLDDTSFAKYFRKEGMEQGKQEGEKKKAKDIANKLIKLGSDDSYISQITDLSVEEVKKLRDEVENDS